MTEQQREDQQYMFHPNMVMLFILLFGLSMLFLALTVSYVYTRVTMNVQPIQVPPLFFINTFILLGSSFTMIRAKKAYTEDNTKEYEDNLKYSIWLSFLFMVAQVFTWIWLFNMNQVTLKTSTTAGYLYVISFTHLLHVLAGLPFLFLFYYTARKKMIDPVTVMVYFSDPEKRLKLRLLTIYWHFLDGLWIYLVLFLLVNALV